MKNHRQQLRAWAQKSQGTRHMGAIAKHAARYLVVATSELDQYPLMRTVGNGGQPTPDLAGLHGVRFLRTSEPERGSVLAEALIKLVTSGEPMLVRHLNRPFFELRPQFKLIISGNYKPRIAGTDDGIWRRM